MEQPNAQTEDTLFYNLDNTREAKPVDYPQDNTTTPNQAVAKLNGNDPDKRIGPSIILKVMAGDTIQAAVRAFYRQQATPQNNAGLPAEQMLSGLVQALAAPAMQVSTAHNTILSSPQQATGPGLTANDLQGLKQKDPNNLKDDKPKAYLNYVFFDKQLKFVEEGSGVKQVNGEPNQLETLSSGKVVAKKNGYVYVYTSNESQQDVLFDNLGVLDITGPVLEETHYYPFGLTMTGISTVAPLRLEGKVKFQGQELQHKEFSDGSGLETYQFKYRMDDPQTGRFWQIDPLADKYVYNSPYAFSENKVTGDIELEGLESIPINPIGELWHSAGITSATDAEQYAKDFGKGLLKPSTLKGGLLMTAEIGVPIIMTEVMTGGVGSLTVLKGEATTLDVGSLSAETGEINLAERATEIHSSLPSRTQRATTTAVASATTANGETVTLVGSSEPYLRAPQKVALQPGEIPVTGGGDVHAEVRVINYANANGMNVKAVAASRPICEGCAAAINNAGAQPASPLKVNNSPAVDATYVKPQVPLEWLKKLNE